MPGQAAVGATIVPFRSFAGITTVTSLVVVLSHEPFTVTVTVMFRAVDVWSYSVSAAGDWLTKVGVPPHGSVVTAIVADVRSGSLYLQLVDGIAAGTVTSPMTGAWLTVHV